MPFGGRTIAGRVRSVPVGNLESRAVNKAVIRAARDAVARALSGLRADMSSLDSQVGSLEPFPIEAGQAMLRAVVDELDTSLWGPVRDMLAALAVDQPRVDAFWAHLTVLNLSGSCTRLSGSGNFDTGRSGPISKAERLLAGAHQTLGEIFDRDFRPEPYYRDPEERTLEAQPTLVRNPESELVILTAYRAVVRALIRLRAEKDWLFEHRALIGYPGPSRSEADDAVLRGVVHGLNTSVGPVQAEWAALADQHPGTPVQLGYRQFRNIPGMAAAPVPMNTLAILDIAEARMRTTRDCLEGAVYYLRRAPDDPKPEERALRPQPPLTDNPERVIRVAGDAIDRALSRVRASMDVLKLSGLEEAERSEIGRSMLRGVMADLNASVGPPVLAVWGMLAGDHPNPSFRDPASGYVGIALYAFHDAFRHVDSPFAQHTMAQVAGSLRHAKSYLEGSVYYIRAEPENDDSEREGPTQYIGSRPPGPRFVDDSDDDSQQRDASRPVPDPSGAVPGSSVAHADVDSGIPLPYYDLRDPWVRRVLRRNRRDAGSQ